MDIIDRLNAQVAYLNKTFPGKNRQYVSEAYMGKLFDDLFNEALADLHKSNESIVWLREHSTGAVQKANIKLFYDRLLRLAQAMQPLRDRYKFAPIPAKSKLDIVDYTRFLVETLV